MKKPKVTIHTPQSIAENNQPLSRAVAVLWDKMIAPLVTVTAGDEAFLKEDIEEFCDAWTRRVR